MRLGMQASGLQSHIAPREDLAWSLSLSLSLSWYGYLSRPMSETSPNTSSPVRLMEKTLHRLIAWTPFCLPLPPALILKPAPAWKMIYSLTPWLAQQHQSMLKQGVERGVLKWCKVSSINRQKQRLLDDSLARNCARALLPFRCV